VIGADGLEWRLVLDMLAEQRLPEIARLIRDGTSARLETFAPALSPPIWTSMATGVAPSRHGILAFVRPDIRGRDGEPLLFTNRERRVKAIWNMADDAGLRSCVVGYWMTFPVEQTRGVMVAQTGAPPGNTGEHVRKGALQAGRSGQVHPPEYEERAFSIAAESHGRVPARERELFGDTSVWAPAMKRLVEHSRWSLEADTAYQQIALDLVGARDRCDLVIVYLGLPDVLGHRFWRWTYPGDFGSPPPQEEVARYGEVMRRTYEQVDAFVGQMRRATGSRATVVLASDHGMGAFRPKANVDLSRDGGELVRTGGHSAARDAFLAAAGPAVARASRQAPAKPADVAQAGGVLDVTPTLLAMLALPRGTDMDGRVMHSLLDADFLTAHPLHEIATHTPKDWAATRRLAEAADPAHADRLEQLRGLGYLE